MIDVLMLHEYIHIYVYTIMGFFINANNQVKGNKNY